MALVSYLKFPEINGESQLRDTIDKHESVLPDPVELLLLTFAEAVSYDSFDFSYRSVTKGRPPEGGGAQPPTDTLSLNFARIKYDYNDGGGRAGAAELADRLDALFDAAGLNADARVTGGGRSGNVEIDVSMKNLSVGPGDDILNSALLGDTLI
jgi:hypothetical protein